MFKHVVAWEFIQENKREHMLAMKRLLEELPELIPDLKEVEVGINVRESKLAMDMVLITSFEDQAGYQVYATHPEHKRVVDELHKVTVNAVIVDYQTP